MKNILSVKIQYKHSIRRTLCNWFDDTSDLVNLIQSDNPVINRGQNSLRRVESKIKRGKAKSAFLLKTFPLLETWGFPRNQHFPKPKIHLPNMHGLRIKQNKINQLDGLCQVKTSTNYFVCFFKREEC